MAGLFLGRSDSESELSNRKSRDYKKALRLLCGAWPVPRRVGMAWHELAALPYAEKVRILLRLQHMGDAIGQTRGAAPRAWPINEETLMPLGKAFSRPGRKTTQQR